MESKVWYKSKTLWVNIIAIIAVLCNAIWGINMDAETQVVLSSSILAIVNIVLRITTKQALKK